MAGLSTGRGRHVPLLLRPAGGAGVAMGSARGAWVVRRLVRLAVADRPLPRRHGRHLAYGRVHRWLAAGALDVAARGSGWSGGRSGVLAVSAGQPPFEAHAYPKDGATGGAGSAIDWRRWAAAMDTVGLTGDAGGHPVQVGHIDAGRQQRFAHDLAVSLVHAELRWLPCSPRCANWLRYGVQPEHASPALIPARAGRRSTTGTMRRRLAHSRDGPVRAPD